jgi:hypothetical protein
MKEKYSIFLISMLIGISIGCTNVNGEYVDTEVPPTVIATITSSVTPSEPPNAISTDTPVVTAESAFVIIEDCVTPLLPENGTSIPAIGRTTFSWTSMDSAASYGLEIFLPSGSPVLFKPGENSYPLYMESLSPGGTFQWHVIAYDDQGLEICSSEWITFEKLAYQPPEDTPVPDDNSKESDPVDLEIDPTLVIE